MRQIKKFIQKMSCLATIGPIVLILCFATDQSAVAQPRGRLSETSSPSAAELGIEFVKDSSSTVIVTHNGQRYVVDLVARTISQAGVAAAPAMVSDHNPESRSAVGGGPATGATLFSSNCSKCHGMGGKGVAGLKTPDFTDPKIQASLTDTQIIDTINQGRKGTMMPAWQGKLSGNEIKALAAYIRSLGETSGPRQSEGARATQENSKVYEPGDDNVFTLPTGRRLDRHGVYVNFTHRFAFDPAFNGPSRGHLLGGLDGFAISSFGFRFGVTEKISLGAYRSPSAIGRPIQLSAAYNFLDEHDGQPINGAFRVSIEGRNDFSRDFTTNLEGIFSRSLTKRAQIYVVPTVSLQDRKLVGPVGSLVNPPPHVPGINAFSLGVGGALDIRPSVALVAEVIPTLVNSRALEIHRPAYAFGIQKKIWRHAFTFGVSTGPGTTISQRAGTRAAFLGDPTADAAGKNLLGGLFVGFDLTRQIY